MNVHSRARTTPLGRVVMVDRVLKEGWTAREAADAAGVSERTVHKWIRRYRDEGHAGLFDRRSRPHRTPSRTPERREQAVIELRRCRMSGPEIADRLKMPISTVARVLDRHGLNRLDTLEPREPKATRYEREHVGELVHLDVKKLGRFRRPGHRIHGDRRRDSRGAGWEYVFVAIDDASRLAYAEIYQDERGDSAVRFIENALAFYARHGIRVQRFLTDNGACFKSHRFAQVCSQRGVKHRFTRPYRPQTNGKAERFIQTMLKEWAYKRAYRTSRERARCLPRWLRYYNHRRPHGSLRRRPPIQRVQEDA